MFRINIFYFFIYLSINIFSSASPHDEKLSIKYGSRTLIALQKLFDFFETDARDLNLDGLYGVRIAQGQLNELQRQLTASNNGRFHLTDHKNIIQSLIEQVERIANVSLAAIAEEQSEYLHKFTLVATQPFVAEFIPRHVRLDLVRPGSRTSHFNEEKSDRCFSELLGTRDSTSNVKCLISESCWHMMTSPMTEDYRLTHQLLWFLIGKSVGCMKVQSQIDLANEKFHHLEDQFCAYIYKDAESNLLQNHNQDLFLEQLLLCSMIGYEEFFRLDWLEAVLSWQHPDYGCYSDASENIRFQPKAKRHLLFEKQMNHECLSHKSGLAAGLLATYTRVFLR